jgi:hypothetical protein
MKIKTTDLTGAALDWAVAKALGANLTTAHEHFRRIAASAWSEEKIAAQLSKMDNYPCWVNTVGNSEPIPAYSTNWAQGGPIIDREDISFRVEFDGRARTVHAEKWPDYSKPCEGRGIGPDHLIAGMRCFVASRLGDGVDVPEELCRG